MWCARTAAAVAVAVAGASAGASTRALRRHAPADPTGRNTLVCGPPAIVAGVSAALTRIGLPPAATQAEGFG